MLSGFNTQLSGKVHPWHTSQIAQASFRAEKHDPEEHSCTKQSEVPHDINVSVTSSAQIDAFSTVQQEGEKVAQEGAFMSESSSNYSNIDIPKSTSKPRARFGHSATEEMHALSNSEMEGKNLSMLLPLPTHMPALAWVARTEPEHDLSLQTSHHQHSLVSSASPPPPAHLLHTRMLSHLHRDAHLDTNGGSDVVKADDACTNPSSKFSSCLSAHVPYPAHLPPMGHSHSLEQNFMHETKTKCEEQLGFVKGVQGAPRKGFELKG